MSPVDILMWSFAALAVVGVFFIAANVLLDLVERLKR